MAYSYDRTAAAKKDQKLDPIVPSAEMTEVRKALSEAYWTIKQWQMRKGLPEHYAVTPVMTKAVEDAWDAWHALDDALDKMGRG